MWCSGCGWLVSSENGQVALSASQVLVNQISGQVERYTFGIGRVCMVVFSTYLRSCRPVAHEVSRSVPQI